MKLKKGVFQIALNPRSISAAAGDDGKRQGWICGPLAIHGNKYGYTITHLASGLIAGQTSGFARTKELLTKMLALPIDWTISDTKHLFTEDTQAMMRALTAEYRA